LLLEGGSLYIMADSWVGRELFRIALPGGELLVRAGWLALWKQTGARVVPVTARLDGRVQVITVHPPLPRMEPEPEAHLAACREILTRLVEDYVARWPAQCPALLFPPEVASPGGGPRPTAPAALAAARRDDDASAYRIYSE
jgi:lauroyl/myristoyl acyltransferase